MRSIIPVVVAMLMVLPLFSSFSTAMQQETEYDGRRKASNLEDNGTVTLTIRNGFNTDGFLSRIGFTLDIDNTLGTKELNYSYCITYNYFFRGDSVEVRNPSTLYAGAGVYTNVLNLPFPSFPYKVSIIIVTNTTNQLVHLRRGIMLFNCYLLFTDGSPESVTGES
jgi:hypothetical protein